MSEPAIPPLATAQRPLRKRLRRAGWILLGFLGILLVIFLLLPVWMSNEQGRLYVLGRLNRGSAAKLSADDWSLSWFRGTRIKNLSITLPDNTRLLFCPRVKTELTLWGILLGHYDVGTTTIDTLQLALTKYADGTTSLDALAGAPATPGEPASSRLFAQFRSARGSLRVQSAVVTINSAAANESITYTDVDAAVTIAAPDAPFHLRVIAMGPDRSLSLNATLPAPADWPPKPWMLLSDMDLTATNLPTGLACDWVRLDPRWRQSLGPVIEKLTLSHHESPSEPAEARLAVRCPSSGTGIDARCLLRALPAAATLTLPAGSDYHIDAALFPSPPLEALLAHVNPIFRALRSSEAPLAISLTSAAWSTDQPAALTATCQVTFPALSFERTGILGQLLTFAGEPPTAPPGMLPLTASPLRVQADAGELSFSNFFLTSAGRRIRFSGGSSPEGRLRILATIPLDSGGVLQMGTADVPIGGTVAQPALTLPH